MTSTSGNEISVLIEDGEDGEEEEEDGNDNCVVASHTKKLQVEYRLMPRNLCIFKVPTWLREINEKAFIPQALSIGPLHRNKLEEYEAMERYKATYLEQFFCRRPSVTLKDCMAMLKRHEKKARECYGDDIMNLASDEFLEMMMLDGCFIVEYFVRRWKPDSIRELQYDSLLYDPLICHSYFLNIIRDDLLLLENQLPFFVLDALFNLINITSDSEKIWEISFRKLALIFYGWHGDPSTLREPAHLIDLIFQTCIPFQSSEWTDKKQRGRERSWSIPRATLLWDAGVKFRAAPEGRQLVDIRFENGILEIPKFEVASNTELLSRNLIAYEQCYNHSSYMVDYYKVMDDLIPFSSDVALLKSKGIITSSLGDDEEVSNMVNYILKNVYPRKGFQYSDLYNKLNRYCHAPWRKWKVRLKRNYFSTPWSIVAFAAAIILLILTFIQTVFAIIQTVK